MGPAMGDRDDGDPVRARLAWLRGAHPDAVVGALGRDSLPTDVPEALRFPAPPPPPAPGAPTGLEAVDPQDRAHVLRAYERARATGVAAVAARLLDGDRVQIHFVDLRDTDGVVLTAAIADDGSLPVDDHVDTAPRFSWARLAGNGSLLDVGPAHEHLFGFARPEALALDPRQLIHPDDHGRMLDNWLKVLVSPGDGRRYRARHFRRDGSYVWVDITNTNRLDDPAHGDVLSEIVDVSDEMQVHEALAEREQILRELTDALPVGVVVFDADHRAVHENGRFAAIVGAAGIDGLVAEAASAGDAGGLDAALAAIAEGVAPKPVELHLAGGRVCRVTLRPLANRGGLACVDDVTEAVRLRRELEVRATFDALTSCFSRSAILGALHHLIDTAPGTGVVFVDLDRFKPVNDELGHAAGDELLAVVGERLREAVREVDLVGRLGGDEFLVVCPGVADAAGVEAIAARIAEHLAAPMALAEVHLVRPRASIGIAWAAAGTDPAALVATADAAMYEAKREARASGDGTTLGCG
jgi:diguanylate cyclase (GGDEF)-like protein/PAS domain S-box-containing protein